MKAKYKHGYYYAQLDIDGQYCYDCIARAVSAYDSYANTNFSNRLSLRQPLLAVKYDNPELFYWNLDESELVDNKLLLSYYTSSECEAWELISLLRAKRKELILNIINTTDPKDSIAQYKSVFDFLSSEVKYADNELLTPRVFPSIYDIQGALLNKRAVCLGIALAFNYICDGLRLPSALITGKAKVAGYYGPHGWNQVGIEGEKYQIDATMAGLEYKQEDKDKHFMYKY